MEIIKGRVFVLGDDVDTDQILPGYAMAEPFENLGRFALAGAKGLDFASCLRPGDIIVAGRNFGCGSSREQAPIALKMAGVALVIAKGFARIFRRNAINIGLPVYAADLTGLLQDGDILQADLAGGRVVYPGGVATAPPLSASALKTLDFGGLIPRVRAELGIVRCSASTPNGSAAKAERAEREKERS
jgi:3-isopropylmalate dehydratase small subunit